jgi:uncharacterized membrane protein YidH (DUF202 family)
VTGPVTGTGGRERPEPGDDQEERDTGLARERTALSWTRTAIAFGAIGGAVLKVNLVSGLVILAMAPVIWQLGRVSRGKPDGTDLPAVGATRLFFITVAIVAVALICLAIAIFGRSAPGALR